MKMVTMKYVDIISMPDIITIGMNIILYYDVIIV